MHPRTLAIVLVLILTAGLGLRLAVVKFSLLPVSEEAVLKRAVAVTVFYNLNNVNKDLKALTIDEPDELKDLLAELRIRREDYIGFGMRGTRRHPVKFHFPNGQVRDHFLEGPNQLGEFVVDRGFYEKLCEIVSRHEGRTVDVLEFHPIPVPPPKIRFNISPPKIRFNISPPRKE